MLDSAVELKEGAVKWEDQLPVVTSFLGLDFTSSQDNQEANYKFPYHLVQANATYDDPAPKAKDLFGLISEEELIAIRQDFTDGAIDSTNHSDAMLRMFSGKHPDLGQQMALSATAESFLTLSENIIERAAWDASKIKALCLEDTSLRGMLTDSTGERLSNMRSLASDFRYIERLIEDYRVDLFSVPGMRDEGEIGLRVDYVRNRFLEDLKVVFYYVTKTKDVEEFAQHMPWLRPLIQSVINNLHRASAILRRGMFILSDYICVAKVRRGKVSCTQREQDLWPRFELFSLPTSSGYKLAYEDIAFSPDLKVCGAVLHGKSLLTLPSECCDQLYAAIYLGEDDDRILTKCPTYKTYGHPDRFHLTSSLGLQMIIYPDEDGDKSENDWKDNIMHSLKGLSSFTFFTDFIPPADTVPSNQTEFPPPVITNPLDSNTSWESILLKVGIGLGCGFSSMALVYLCRRYPKMLPKCLRPTPKYNNGLLSNTCPLELTELVTQQGAASTTPILKPTRTAPPPPINPNESSCITCVPKKKRKERPQGIQTPAGASTKFDALPPIIESPPPYAPLPIDWEVKLLDRVDQRFKYLLQSARNCQKHQSPA